MEITEADVIVLVVDASDSLEEIDRKISACMTTFSEIGANGIPIVVALNKTDLITEDEIKERIERFEDIGNSIISISAMDKVGLDALIDMIEEELPALVRFQIFLPYGDEGMSILSWLYEVGSIKSEEYRKKSIQVEAELDMNDAQKLMRMNPDVEVVRIQE